MRSSQSTAHISSAINLHIKSTLLSDIIGFICKSAKTDLLQKTKSTKYAQNAKHLSDLSYRWHK